MDLERLQSLILLVLIFGVAALGVWYLAVRLRSPQVKAIAVMLAALPVLVIGVEVASHFFDFGSPAEFKDTAVGPASREASVTRDLPFPVNDQTLRHEILLTPRARTGAIASRSIDLKYFVKSPSGDMLIEKTEALAAAQVISWPVARAEFQPTEHGEYTLHIEIPNPVGEVLVRIREIRK